MTKVIAMGRYPSSFNVRCVESRALTIEYFQLLLKNYKTILHQILYVAYVGKGGHKL